jgi:hypothetical protein
VKPAEILIIIRGQFGDEKLSRTKCMIGESHIKKAGERLKTGKDYTSCKESKGQRFLETLKAYYSSIF